MERPVDPRDEAVEALRQMEAVAGRFLLGSATRLELEAARRRAVDALDVIDGTWTPDD